MLHVGSSKLSYARAPRIPELARLAVAACATGRHLTLIGKHVWHPPSRLPRGPRLDVEGSALIALRQAGSSVGCKRKPSNHLLLDHPKESGT